MAQASEWKKSFCLQQKMEKGREGAKEIGGSRVIGEARLTADLH
jgi:hypothetical protein